MCNLLVLIWELHLVDSTNDNEKSMQTMVPYHLRQYFHGRRRNLNLAETYFKKMGFRPVSNGGEYIKQILQGDIHTYNQKAAGLDSRDTAKTFIYAFIYAFIYTFI